MIIVPTKKSLPLFSEFPISTITSSSTERFFFSWHANYFTLDRKKVLVLVNDLSFSPIVLVDINAKNKQQLSSYIKEGIEHIFSYSTAKQYKIKKYFLKAGRMEISYAYNRSISGINNNMIQMLKSYPEDIDLNSRLQTSVMEFLAKTPYRSMTPEYSFSIDIVKKELDKL
ncbi:DUF6933 domain-containing protein [Enterococcus termitis]|uniref:DUF6933 domain-containing protein n=1 Tax=Enterococcus termitis TaxID=332950 RepID=A0A1E5H0X4_9ENTE|nr:hypothetical protein [Enterococcus termitis]OEG18647.1 hypothetical protein BCR25_15705 [Enterococcus termitis]OJG97636.1 hypothetical protein RV18_GL000704 [Enterococcus termitis]